MRTPINRTSALVLAACSGFLILQTIRPGSLSAAQINLGQFSSTDPVITFETASPFLPNVPGLQFAGGDALPGDGTNCFGSQYFGNRNGSTFLDVYFDQPQQAVGAYIVEASPLFGTTGVVEVAYDQSGNVIESASGTFPPWQYSPAFVGIGETNIEIYHVQWRYLGAPGTFGIDNLIYGRAIGLDQLPSIPTGLTASHQDLQVTLKWSPADWASAYNVKQGAFPGGPFTNVATGVTNTSYTDTVTQNGLYYYVVSGVNTNGESPDSQPAAVYVLDRFAFTRIALNQTSGVPFELAISALDSNNFRVLNFNSTALLTGVGDHGPVQVVPGLLQFINGQWTGTVSVASAFPDTNIRLNFSSNGVAGVSNPFDAAPPAIQEFDFYAADLLYDPKAQRIYATVPAASPNFSNCLVVIDPVVGRIETNYFLGDDPQKMALSDDGQFLYAGFNGSNVVRRINLISNAVDLQIQLGNNSYYNAPYTAADLTVIPGMPRSVVITGVGLVIFDDGIQRSNTFGLGATVVAPSPTELFTSGGGYPVAPFARLTIDPSGVTGYVFHDGLVGPSETMKYQDGLVFTSGGRVFNPETTKVLGYLPSCAILEPDLASGRVFTMASHPVWAHPDAWTLYACDPVTLQPLANSAMDGVAGTPISLIRWGTNGVAIAMYQGHVFLVRTPLVPNPPSSDLLLGVLDLPPSIPLYSNLTYTIQITNQGPNDTLVTSFLDLLPQGANFVSASSTLGSCLVSNGVVTCDLGNLRKGSSGTLTLVVSPTVIGPLTNLALVSGAAFDPDMANNSSVTVVTCQNPPFVTTQPPWVQGPSNATLNGMGVPNGLDTMAWFEWGARGAFDAQTPPASLGAGSATIRLSAPLTNLNNGVVYQCRLVVSNSLGLAVGATRLFSTGRRIVAWGDNSAGQLNIPTGLSNVVALAAGRFHSLGLLSDGTVAAWGANNYGQLNLPIGLSNVVAIAAGDSDCLALKSDGTVVGWGQNYAGQANIPGGLGGIIAISQGVGHDLALLSNGTVAAWGDNEAQQCSVPPGLSNVVAVAAGYMHSEALKADGTVACWGQVRQTDVPTNLPGVVAITAGNAFGAALKSDGTVVQWPGGGVVSNLTNEIALSANFANLLALETNGTVDFGAPSGLSNTCILAAGVMHGLADGNNLPPAALPLLLSSVPNQDLVIPLQGSDLNADLLAYRITILPSAGALYQFTNGGRGAIIATPNEAVQDPQHRVIFAAAGTGRPPDGFTYVVNDGQADSLPATVSLNIGSTLASTQPATLIAPTRATLNGMVLPNGMDSVAWFEWGVPGQHTNATSPQPVGSGGTVVRISQQITGLVQPALYQFRAVMSNAIGTIYGAPSRFTTGEKVAVWGGGQFGLDSVPRSLGLAVGVAAGYNHDLVIQSGGTVVAWGDNSYQQTNVPAGLGNVVAVAAGNGQSLALASDRTVNAWGRNEFGQGSVPPGMSNVVAIAAGAEHDLALIADGSVMGWGRNDSGQASVPISVSNAVAIAAGKDFSVALKADGTVLSWGNAPLLPPGLTNVVAIAAGDSHILALRLDGSVAAWGSNIQGQTNVPLSALSNVFGIGKGVSHSLALTSDGAVVAWGNNDSGQALPPAGLNHVVAASGAEHNSITLGGNVPPQALSLVTNGPENRDLVIRCGATDPNGDAVSTRVSLLPTVGGLYQFSAGARGPAILSFNTLISDPSGRVIFVPFVNSFGSPYTTFSFVANDGQVDSKPGTIVVNVVPGIVPVLNVGPRATSAPFTFTLLADSNGTYGVWTSTNLMNWSLIGPFTPLSNGWFFFSDPDSTNQLFRFYKAQAR